MTGRGWRELLARMFERQAEPEASFEAAALSGKAAEPWRVGIVGWFDRRVGTAYFKRALTRHNVVSASVPWMTLKRSA